MGVGYARELGEAMPRSFRLLSTLGEGAFGAVHLAEVQGDEGFVQRLAVKWLHPQWSHDAELAGRLRDEARLLAMLNHDHIVRVHGLTRIDGRLAVLMEPIEGVDLSRLTEPIPPRAAVEIVGAVADALDAAWEAVPPGGGAPLRVVHRDIKPSNVMVTPRGGVKVMDFGVARATFDAREAQTRSQQFGTARYMAPERWLHGQADAPSDVFSLGLTLVELVAGRPVERPRLSAEGYAEDIGRALEALGAWPAVRELAARMTAYRPEHRPHARDVARACRDLAGMLPGPSLRDWAPGFIHRAGTRPPPGPRDGSLLVEDQSGETFEFVPAPTADTAAFEPRPPIAPVQVALVPTPPPRPLAHWAGLSAALLGAAALFGWVLIRGAPDDARAVAPPEPPVAATASSDTETDTPGAADPPTSEPGPIRVAEPVPAPDAGTAGEEAPPPAPAAAPPKKDTPPPRKAPGKTAPAPEPEAPPESRVAVRFVWEAPVARVRTPAGDVTSPRGGVDLPTDKPVSVEALDASGRRVGSCTILPAPASEWLIGPETCRQTK